MKLISDQVSAKTGAKTMKSKFPFWLLMTVLLILSGMTFIGAGG